MFKADVESVKEKHERKVAEGCITEQKVLGRWEDPGKQRNGKIDSRSVAVLEPINEKVSHELDNLDQERVKSSLSSLDVEKATRNILGEMKVKPLRKHKYRSFIGERNVIQLQRLK